MKQFVEAMKLFVPYFPRLIYSTAFYNWLHSFSNAILFCRRKHTLLNSFVIFFQQGAMINNISNKKLFAWFTFCRIQPNLQFITGLVHLHSVNVTPNRKFGTTIIGIFIWEARTKYTLRWQQSLLIVMQIYLCMSFYVFIGAPIIRLSITLHTEPQPI